MGWKERRGRGSGRNEVEERKGEREDPNSARMLRICSLVHFDAARPSATLLMYSSPAVSSYTQYVPAASTGEGSSPMSRSPWWLGPGRT